jgi:cellulose synthase/poly-beta-1,6-N-acetylglucosamine synthase-like glycosyltransferase
VFPIFTALAVTASTFVSIYAFNVLALLLMDFKPARDVDPPLDEHPVVTVQIPVYNETLVQRALANVTALDYPRDRLQIQVLDDSTDPAILALEARLVARYQRQGFDVTLVHRDHRTGYKAGALNHGLTTARGAYVLVVDADNLIPAEFLTYVLPFFATDPRLAYVQSRCEYTDRWFNWVTEANAVSRDMHYLIEQPAKNRYDLHPNFSGNAGVWRKAVLDQYGWDEAVLTEDIELSYRTQIDGWKALYLSDIACHIELPPTLSALKRQQERWTSGFVQSLRKLWRGIVTSRHISLTQKLETLIYLSFPLAHIGTLAAVILWVFAALFEPATTTTVWLELPILTGFLASSSIGPILTAATAAFRGNDDGKRTRKLLTIGVTMTLATATLIANAKAVLQALRAKDLTFHATAKYGLTDTPVHASRPTDTLVVRLRRNWLELVAATLGATAIGLLVAMGQITSAIPLLYLTASWLFGAVVT